LREGFLVSISPIRPKLREETKVLKQLVRNIIQPERDLGHSDSKPHKSREEEKEERDYKNTTPAEKLSSQTQEGKQDTEACEDCK